jgi:hypothetical protein
VNKLLLILVLAIVLLFFIYPRPKGYIKIDTVGAEMTLRSGWFRTTTITAKQGAVEVPSGTYRPVRAKITADRGDLWWSVQGYGSWGNLSSVKVIKGLTTIVKLGPPFTLRNDVYRSGRTVSIGLSMVGREGEYWRAQLLTNNASDNQKPRLKIVDESGNVLASGSFEYG